MKIIKVEKGMESSILNFFKNRKDEDLSNIDSIVESIIDRVRNDGDKGLLEITKEIDQIELDNVKVTEEEIEEGFNQVEEDFVKTLEKSAENIRSFHENQYETSWRYEKKNDVILGQIINPLESVGIYVPGGKAAYPSTVLMNAIPAKIAGVERIAMATPPGKDGKINPYILAAAKIAGVDEIYKIGGAQAVAAFAYGTETINSVRKIVGPGNIYVARAKKILFGLVDIDMIAGPSEICVIADDEAEVEYVAADILSQAEHDEMAASILITTSVDFAKKVVDEVYLQLKTLPRADIARKSIDVNGMAIIAEDIDSAFKISNAIAPEHLEIMLDKPMDYVNKVKNAGAVFLGKYSPEPLGDYIAGPNHTLPTSGTAAYASPLGVYDFVKRSSLIYYSEAALRSEKDYIVEFSNREGLTAHGNAIKVRFK